MNTINHILNKFAEYTDFDTNQTSFNLLSSTYEFHKAGKLIETLLSEYDPSGMFGVLYAKSVFESVMKDSRVEVYKLLQNPELLKEEIEMHTLFNGEEIKEVERLLLDSIKRIFEKITKDKRLGENDLNVDSVLKQLPSVLKNLQKLNVDVFKKDGIPGKINNISTKIHVFETYAECALATEKAEDGLYLCFVSANNSADCFFAFMYKSNGTMFAINDRIDETYIGQHSHMRNARWTEDKADDIFPYDYIFKYSNHDYKGYATTYEINEEKLSIYELGEDVFIPIILTMILVINKYKDRMPEEPIHYISSLTVSPSELLETTELLDVSKSEIAAITRSINLSYDMEKLLNGTYADEFAYPEGVTYTKEKEHAKFNNYNQALVDRYGKDFVPNVADIFKGNLLCLMDKENKEYEAEFVGTEQKFRLQLYYQMRKQLAEHIKEKMAKEYEDFGGASGVEKWFMSLMKDRIEELIKFAMSIEPQFIEKQCSSLDFNDVRVTISNEKNDMPNPYYHLNTAEGVVGQWYDRVDAVTGKPLTYGFRFEPLNEKGISFLTGINVSELPGFMQIYRNDSGKYNGNSILNIVDYVSAIKSPLNDRSYIEREYKFNCAICFAKSHWNQIKKEYNAKTTF